MNNISNNTKNSFVSRKTKVNTTQVRFKGEMKAQTGIDPLGSFAHFTSNDVIKNIDVHREKLEKEKKPLETKEGWAIGTTKKKLVVKEINDDLQSKTMTDKKKSTFDKNAKLKTDHISTRPPGNSRPFQKMYDAFQNIETYEGNSETKVGWVPQIHQISANNSSTEKYNIITHQDNPFYKKDTFSVNAVKSNNRTRGLTEFAEMTRLTNPNLNENYQKALNDNNFCFYRKTGVFTHMYDAAARCGNLSVPFKNN